MKSNPTEWHYKWIAWYKQGACKICGKRFDREIPDFAYHFCEPKWKSCYKDQTCTLCGTRFELEEVFEAHGCRNKIAQMNQEEGFIRDKLNQFEAEGFDGQLARQNSIKDVDWDRLDYLEVYHDNGEKQPSIIVPWPEGAKPLNGDGFFRQVDVKREFDALTMIIKRQWREYRYLFGYELDGQTHGLVCNEEKILMVNKVM